MGLNQIITGKRQVAGNGNVSQDARSIVHGWGPYDNGSIRLLDIQVSTVVAGTVVFLRSTEIWTPTSSV